MRAKPIYDYENNILNYIHDSIFSGSDYYVDNELVSYVILLKNQIEQKRSL